MNDVTADQVKAAMIAAELTWIAILECSICGTPIGYVRQGEQLFFNSNCDCVRYRSEPEPKSWEDVAYLINRQNEEWKPKIASLFGIKQDQKSCQCPAPAGVACPLTLEQCQARTEGRIVT